MTPAAKRPSFLVVRRDNIGDLVCTTPLIAGLRARYPEAWIAALVNRYTEPVLAGNTDLDAVFSYQKGKHRLPGETVLGLYLQRLRMLLGLRRRAIDYVILASPGYQRSAERLARWVKPRHVIGFDNGSGNPAIFRLFVTGRGRGTGDNDSHCRQNQCLRQCVEFEVTGG